MNRSKSDQLFLESINRKLDQSVIDIEPSTKAALLNIRQKALVNKDCKSGALWSLLKPAPLMATVSIVLLLSVSLRMTLDTTNTLTPALEDIPILTATDDIEFYNDLDFYQWLEAEKLNG